MNSLAKLFGVLIVCGVPSVHATDNKPIVDHRLDEHTVYTVPVSRFRVTTINFPGPISAIDGAHVTNDPKIPGLFQLAHTKGSSYLSVRALVQMAATNINVRWNKKTYVIMLVESDTPLYSVILSHETDTAHRQPPVRVTPTRLLALLDKAKAYPLLKANHPQAVAHVDHVSYAATPRVMDYKQYDLQIEEVFRFNPEDTLVFRVLLRNKTDAPIEYRPDGFALRVGDRTYPQSISDASGTMPPRSEVPAWFAVTGTPNGGRNDLSTKNEFTVLLDRIEPAGQPQPETSN